ncbi:MAG: glycosyltransferase [Chloroflexota bacterium]
MISPISVSPANAGDKVRIQHIAKGLAQHHNVTFVSPIDDVSNPKEKKQKTYRETIIKKETSEGLFDVPVPIRPSTRIQQIRSLCARWPYHTALRYRPKITQRVRQLMDENEYDLVYCHLLQTLPYVTNATIPIVLDQQNVDRLYWQRQTANYSTRSAHYWLSRLNHMKTIRFETQILPQLSAIVSVSAEERAETCLYADGKVPYLFVAPNGVDASHYKLGRKDRPQDKFVLGFLGSLALASNQRAVFRLVEQILPAVQQQLPYISISTLIIGRNPPQNLLNFAARHPEKQITVTGEVEDVLPYLHQVDIMALPLQSGAGTKLRVLEAMAAGVCVVGSPIALAGFDDFVDGKHVLLANNNDDFVAAVCMLANNVDLRYAMRHQAHDLVVERYNWDRITSQLANDLSGMYRNIKLKE